jgi:hypothetical protein
MEKEKPQGGDEVRGLVQAAHPEGENCQIKGSCEETNFRPCPVTGGVRHPLDAGFLVVHLFTICFSGGHGRCALLPA